MSESTFKSGRKKGFIVLYREAAQDDRLTLEARGLFALMVSLPENWEYTVSGLAVKAGCGKDKVRRLLRELQTVGYLVRGQSHDRGGKFSGNIYVLQDEVPPSSENTDNGESRQRSEPSTEKPSPVFTAQKNKEEKNKDLKDIQDLKEPPKAPQGGAGRKSQFALEEEAKPVLREYCGQDQELAQALADLIDVRTKRKAVNSRRAIIALLKELDRLSGGRREDKLLLIQQSVLNSWKSVFPLKNSVERGMRDERAGAAEDQDTGRRFSGVTYL